MVAFPRVQGMTGSIPPVGAAIAGAVTVALFTLMPAPALEAMVWNSGIAAIVPAAEPPLAITARAVLAMGGGIVVAAVTWSTLYLLFGPGGFLDPRRARVAGQGPAVRRADAHPDAPPRKPMTAADLGTPMMEVAAAAPAEARLPADLDLPLAAFDPAAIPAAPREPVRPVPSLVAVAPPPPSPAPVPAPAPAPAIAKLAPGERIETFELTPVVRRQAPPPPAASPSIEALLRRLEEGAQRRVARG